jgi:nucleotide-binding universal stress UspA family protein
MLKTLVVPYDGSDSAGRALRQAIALGATLHVINAQPQVDDLAALRFRTQEEIDSFLRERGRSTLEPAAQMLTEAGTPHELHLVVGDPAERIVELAQRLGVDAIVMGTHGRSAIGNLVLGSVATRVVHRAAVPVMLVK